MSGGRGVQGMIKIIKFGFQEDYFIRIIENGLQGKISNGGGNNRW